MKTKGSGNYGPSWQNVQSNVTSKNNKPISIIFNPSTQFPGMKKFCYAKKNVKLQWSLLPRPSQNCREVERH